MNSNACSKWCKHICFDVDGVGYSFIGLGHKIFGHEHVPMHFTHCPYCGEARPRTDDEIELDEILVNFGFTSGNVSFRTSLLTWRQRRIVKFDSNSKSNLNEIMFEHWPNLDAWHEARKRGNRDQASKFMAEVKSSLMEWKHG